MKTNVFDFRDRNSIAEQARQWLIRLDGDAPLTASEIEALQAWAGRSQAHREELLRIAKFWNEANVLAALAIPLHAPRPARSWFSDVLSLARQRWALAACASLVGIGIVLAALVLHRPITSTNATYSTGVGEQRTQELVDGSVIHVNTASELQVAYNEDSRVIRLLRGEAHFSVAHDVGHPFEVFAGTGMVRAVGTAFSVYLQDQEVQVTVSEGLVEFGTVKEPHSFAAARDQAKTPAAAAPTGSPAVEILGVLTSGQRARFGQALDEVRTLGPDDLMHELAWREGMLVFAGEPLGEVVAEVGRYTPITIEIADPTLATLPVGGRFKAGDVEQMLDVLASSFGVRVVRVDALHVRLLANEKTRG